MASSLTSRLSFTGNEEEELVLYPSDYSDAVCSSDGDPSFSLNAADDPVFDDGSSSKETLSFQRQSILRPKEDLTIPLDFELRQSGVPGRGLGIWSCRIVSIGECFGPYTRPQRPLLQNHTQDFEVGTNQMVAL